MAVWYKENLFKGSESAHSVFSIDLHQSITAAVLITTPSVQLRPVEGVTIRIDDTSGQKIQQSNHII